MRTIEADNPLSRWTGQVVVVKYGGSAMTRPELAHAVMQDIVRLQRLGVRVVLAHGGGKAVSGWSQRLGLPSRFVDGLRVTDPETMRLAQMVQVGGISRDITAAIARCGGRAMGLSGQDAGGWLRARVRQHTSRETGKPVDLGRVGDVVHVDVQPLLTLLDAGLVPVVAPIAVDDDLEPLNVNADSVATAVAAALGASSLVFLTDVAGIRGPDGVEARELRARTLQHWLNTGVVQGGMVPKAEACLHALAAGVRRVTVADGRVPHAVARELGTPMGAGTVVHAAREAA